MSQTFELYSGPRLLDYILTVIYSTAVHTLLLLIN